MHLLLPVLLITLKTHSYNHKRFKCYFLKEAFPYFCSRFNIFVLFSLYQCSYSSLKVLQFVITYLFVSLFKSIFFSISNLLNPQHTYHSYLSVCVFVTQHSPPGGTKGQQGPVRVWIPRQTCGLQAPYSYPTNVVMSLTCIEFLHHLPFHIYQSEVS